MSPVRQMHLYKNVTLDVSVNICIKGLGHDSRDEIFPKAFTSILVLQININLYDAIPMHSEKIYQKSAKYVMVPSYACIKNV
jgi:hypothetical protein